MRRFEVLLLALLLQSEIIILLRAKQLPHGLPSESVVDPASLHAQSMIPSEENERVTAHIINGQLAGPGQFPFMAFIYTRNLNQCSASILARGWIISVGMGKVQG